MWPDNETSRDFLNFSGVADTVAEIIVQANGRPVSIGISGDWGIGKSSMIKLTRASLENRKKVDGAREFVFVEFNAWLYQGYDDARAALMDVIATRLVDEANARQKGGEKALSLLKRVNWLRAAKLVAGSGAALAFGIPPVGLLGEVWDVAQRALGKRDRELIEDAEEVGGKVLDETKGLIKPKIQHSPPKEIQALRDDFEETLSELGVTLVVLIDDLDRCLPETTVSTLEAIRLFLFLKNTAFVIAADNNMIKHAVRKHFENVPDDLLVTNYFDKLIQVPIRVPPLGTQEVRAYMMLLFVENSSLSEQAKEYIRVNVCQQLRHTWQGKRVDAAFVRSLRGDLPKELISKLDTADRLAPLMATASGIAGNPRLVKRFLNALAIRMAISNAQGVGVDEAVLAKLLLFERLGNPKAYGDLMTSVNSDEGGRPSVISEWESMASSGKDFSMPQHWDDAFTREWLTLPPLLSQRDLRGALYVSREHAPILTPEDRLSSEGAEVLAALLAHPDMASTLKERLKVMPRAELNVIMDRLLEKARQEQEWGAPSILDACLAVGDVDPPQGARLAAFLIDRPDSQVRPNIIPKIGDQAWADGVFAAWQQRAVSNPVKTALARRNKVNGNIAV